MANHLNKDIGSMEYDKLFADQTPQALVGPGVIRKLGVAATYARGTVLAKSSADNKLVILGTTAESGETLVPDCVLCDDTSVGTSADSNAAVYTAGNFNVNGLTVKSGYTMTESDKDKLRERGIYLGVVWPM